MPWYTGRGWETGTLAGASQRGTARVFEKGSGLQTGRARASQWGNARAWWWGSGLQTECARASQWGTARERWKCSGSWSQ